MGKYEEIEGIEFKDAEDAVNHMELLYNTETNKLIKAYGEVLNGTMPSENISGFYPKVTIKVEKRHLLFKPTTEAYGFFSSEGIYTNTFTRPDLFKKYYLDQFSRILRHHPGIKIKVGASDVPIPLKYADNETVSLKGQLSDEEDDQCHLYFDQPNELDYPNVIDEVRNGNSIYPLSWYSAPHTDRSLDFLVHYTGTNPQFFQKYVLFANYNDYINEFAELGRKLVSDPSTSDDHAYLGFVEPGNVITINKNIEGAKAHFNKVSGERLRRSPQMPAYHLVKEDGSGISIVNIDVGPSNAKTITDHISVLRPELFFMVGHCGGLNSNQRKGDYVIPNIYFLRDGLLEKEGWQNSTELPEIHTATKSALMKRFGGDVQAYKERVRHGPIVTFPDRNWECQADHDGIRSLKRFFAMHNIISVDMESATIMANARKHRIAGGGIFCVSDTPWHGRPKMANSAKAFYRDSVREQFMIAINTVESLAKNTKPLSSTRKFRSDFAYVPFR